MVSGIFEAMKLTERAPEDQPKAVKRWARWKEAAAAVALAGAIGCAHAPEPVYPQGPLSMYSLESAAEPERVIVGNDENVLLRPRVMIRDGAGARAIVDYEAAHQRRLSLAYCWFVFQDAGYEQDGMPVFFLLNPRYSDPGQPRYIGAILRFDDGRGTREAVVPVEPEDVDLDTPRDLFWKFPEPPKRREDTLFYVYPGSVVPVMDALLASRMTDYCRETLSPQYYVPEYGPTRAALAVYPSGPIE